MLARILRLYFVFASSLLIIISIFGTITNGNDYISVCLSVIGITFGSLCLLSEITNVETFFLNFGFLRYRVGRVVLFGGSGIIASLVGYSMNNTCQCSTYTIVMIVGVCNVVAGIGQFAGIFILDAVPNPRPTNVLSPTAAAATKKEVKQPKVVDRAAVEEPPSPPVERVSSPASVDVNASSWMKSP